MQWALVNTEVKEHTNAVFENGIQIMKTYQAQPGTIIEIVVYDGVSKYDPGPGLKLVKVPDSVRRGDSGF